MVLLRPTRSLVLVVLLVLAAGIALEARAQPRGGGTVDAATVWQALRQPGAVVVVRHSYAPGGFDPPDAKLDDCSTQRNLDERGRAQARRMGVVFREQGISTGEVLASPRCRCMDTARLAFGRAEAWEPLQGAINVPQRRAQQLAEIRQRVASHRAGPPLVLVTHGSVVTDLTGLDVRMGELVVMQPATNGAHVTVGRLYID
jgi:phosphohistidine phosphatase SixA